MSSPNLITIRKSEMWEDGKLWENGKYLVFSLMCLVGRVEKWEDGKLFYLVGEKALAKCLFLDCKMGFWCLGRLMFDVYSTLNVTGDCGWAWSSG